MASKCGKCRQIIKDKQVLTCKSCKFNYHLLCTSVSQSRFYNTLTGDHRANWKCESCIKLDNNKPPGNPSIVFPGEAHAENTDNITRRAKKVINISSSISTENSFQSFSLDSESEIEDDPDESITQSATETVLNRSCPESQNLKNYVETEFMKKKIVDLETKLQIAENEIENLIGEICTLKTKLLGKELRMKQLTGFLENTTLNTPAGLSKLTPQNTPKIRKRKSIASSKIGTIKKLHFPNDEISSESNLEKKNNISSEYNLEKENEISSESNLEKKQMVTIHELNKAFQQKYEERERKEIDNDTVKPKLCILSSSSGNNILETAKEKFSDTKICHYITTGGGVKELLKNIEQKLQGFTYNDFCVVFIGEQDFYNSNDYKGLVNHVREKLEKVNNTNIIVAVPTYICGTLIYNSRVEYFNTLLYQDMLRYKYAYYFDTNCNLTLDMFSARTGKLNIYGIENICENLQLLQCDIFSYSNDIIEPKEETVENDLHSMDHRYFEFNVFIEPMNETVETDLRSMDHRFYEKCTQTDNDFFRLSL